MPELRTHMRERRSEVYDGTSTSNSRPWRSIGSFMYIGSAGPGPGGRTDGRTVTDGGRDDFERQYNDFHRFSQQTSKTPCVFLSFRVRRKRKYRFLQLKWKRHPKNDKKTAVFLTFQIMRERKYRFLHLKWKISDSPALPGWAPGNGIFDAARDLENSRRGARMTWVFTNSLKSHL